MHHKSQFVITMVFAVAAIALIIHVPGSDAHKHKFHWKDWGKKKTYDTALKKTGRAFKDAFSAKRAERNAQKIQSGFKTLKKDINRDIIQPALKLTGERPRASSPLTFTQYNSLPLAQHSTILAPILPCCIPPIHTHTRHVHISFPAIQEIL